MSTTRQPKYEHRTVGWGEALVLEIHFRSPGLQPLVKVINSAAGDQGVRNTFARLYDYAEPPTAADPKDYFRAWLLLTALGQRPRTWGVGDDAVPPGYDRDRLRELVISRSGWLDRTADLALTG